MLKSDDKVEIVHFVGGGCSSIPTVEMKAIAISLCDLRGSAVPLWLSN